MRTRRVSIRGLLLGLLACLAGCKDDGMPAFSDNGQGIPTNVLFQLDIAFADKSRSRAFPTGHTSGHALERRLNKLLLFAVPVNRQGDEVEEEWDRVSWIGVPITGETQFPLKVPLELAASGEIRVYVGANLSLGQVNSLIHSREYAVKGEKYYQAINEFAPFSDNPAVRRQTDDIAMFCREAKTINTLTDGNASNRKEKTFDLGIVDLKRMVAKVLVACHTADTTPPGGKDGVAYVPLANDFGTADNPQGWIRQKEVYYFVNNMPRQAVFMQHYADDGSNTLLPNYNLKEVMTDLTTGFIPLEFNMKKVDENFIHYDMQELYRRNRSFQHTLVWNEKDYEDLVSGNVSKDNPYNKEDAGMYTLENLFDLKTEGTPEESFTSEELAQLWAYTALPVITHVSIAAKFTPRYLFVTKEEWEMIKKEQFEGGILEEWVEEWVKVDAPGQLTEKCLYLECRNELVSHAILTSSLRLKGALIEGDGDYDPANKGKYPNDTFFSYRLAEDTSSGSKESGVTMSDRFVFCTYGVAISFNTAGEVDASMVPYTRGWGYYYAYINNNESAAITSAGQLKDACVERNNYYILHVKSIGSMGATITDPNYMRVHTLKATWQEGGEGDIELN